MSKFIDTTDGLLNIDCIVSVRQLSKPREVGSYLCKHVVHYVENGESCTTYTWEPDLVTLTGEIIPALPGFFVVRVCADDDGGDGDSVLPPEPVIAWRIERRGLFVTPILTDGAADGPTNPYGVLRPDGTVEVPHDRCYTSLAEFKRHVAEEARKRAKVRAA